MLGVSKTCREIKDRIYEIQQDRELLKTENAKLRELCVDYDKTLDIAIKGYVGIDKPLLIGANQTALRSRMYELGIEASE